LTFNKLHGVIFQKTELYHFIGGYSGLSVPLTGFALQKNPALKERVRDWNQTSFGNRGDGGFAIGSREQPPLKS
jgi:hypothetical protein